VSWRLVSAEIAADDAALEFELRISNDLRAMDLVAAFARESLRHLPLSEPDSLQELVVAVVRQVIDHAYPPGETGLIVLHSRQLSDHLEITVRDFGLPQDVAKMEAALKNKDPHKWIGQLPHTDAVDAMHWTSYGPEGKQLTIEKSFHDSHIADHGTDLRPFDEKPPLAAEQEYTIRQMTPEDAVKISQLIYKAYGPSYFNRDVYYPDRVVALNADGSVISFVAEGSVDGVVGHYALERNQEGPVAEGGMAVVDPAHRGRKLLDRLKTAAVTHAKEIGLTGMYADAVTVHPFTQKANIALGAKLCGVELGIAPKSETFRGIAAPESPQRITCLLYFLPLQPRGSREVFVPEIYQGVVGGILERLGRPFTMGEPKPPEGLGALRMQLVASAAKACLAVDRVGVDTVSAIRRAKRELIEHSHAEAIFVDLPLSDPASATVAAHLRKEGFSFAGVAPDFLPEGDFFRMVHLIDDLAIEAMQIAEPAARELVEFALADRARVMDD